MDTPTVIVSLGSTIAMAVVGYFVNRLDKRLDNHDARDDKRFEEIGERIDRHAEDATAKRHAFRNEMHVALTEQFNRLYQDMMAMERRLRK